MSATLLRPLRELGLIRPSTGVVRQVLLAPPVLSGARNGGISGWSGHALGGDDRLLARHGRAQCGSRGHPHLPIDAGEVRFNRALRDEEGFGYLPVGVASSCQRSHLCLRRRELEGGRRAKTDPRQL